MSGIDQGTAQAVDRSSALPLWAQIHQDLQRRLDEGEFSGAFPGELALVNEYRVSRHTVREALRRLREDGVVTAERGRAPRLTDVPIAQPLGALYSLFASVEAAGLTQRSVVRALDLRIDDVAAAHLALPAGTELFYLERLRLAADEPLAMDQIWLPAALAAPLLEADFTHTALYTELDQRCGVRLTDGEETISAVLPTAAERDLLDLPRDVAAFSVERRTYHRTKPAEWRQTLVRGDRFTVSARFSERTGYRLDLPAPSTSTRTLPPRPLSSGPPSDRWR